jgi:6-phosphogluconate dehydrogenase
MVHNGIEYALREAYGEGFQVLKASGYGQDMDLKEVAHMWNHGSVIRSWLLGLLEDSFSKDRDLEKIQGYVQDSGEARWTVKEAVDSGVSADVIATALFKRFNSRQSDVFANKVVAALRNEFGGHETMREGENARTDTAGAGTAEHAKPDAQKKGV